MFCDLYDRKGGQRLMTFAADPVCAEDYCDRCGQCLVCDKDRACPRYDQHLWVLLTEDVPLFIKTHSLEPALIRQLTIAVEQAA